MPRLDENGAVVVITFEGRPVAARAGDTVAAALVAAGIRVTRESVVSAAPRGPYCMMGVCFECLAEIDGVPGRQTCMVEVRGGMTVRVQRATAVATSGTEAKGG